MLLQPRKFKFKTRQNNSSAYRSAETNVIYGSVALILLQPLRISAKSIYRLNLFLNNSSRSSDITRRSFWVSIFPHLPLSRKPKGMRMGNGAGNLSTWYTQIRGGNNLIEFKNLRLGRAIYYSGQVTHNLPVYTSIYNSKTNNLSLVQGRRANPDLCFFW